MFETVLRYAREKEKLILEGLQRRASLSNPGDREAILANPDAIELPIDQILNNRVIVAEVDGVVVGFSVVLPRSDGQSELDGLFVEPQVWRSGIGRRLVEGAGEMAKSEGATEIYVIGNPHAEKFYLSVGFRIFGEAQTRFGSGLSMLKKL